MKKSTFPIPSLKYVKNSNTFSYDYMLKSGMIRQVSAGIFSWLPLGYKILNKLSSFIQKSFEKNNIPTFLSPSIQPASLWNISGRYNSYGKETLRIFDRHKNEFIYGPTAEEIATEIFKTSISSYKQMPLIINQISWKFRDEIRPRFGVMRSREFLMQDAYSFDTSEDNAKQTYKKIYSIYMNIFHKLNLQVIACKADSGQIGGDFCHEFNLISTAGESTIFYDEKIFSHNQFDFDSVKDIYAVTEDKHDPSLSISSVKSNKAIEVGHIFYFGTKYSNNMNACFYDSNNTLQYVEMGSYGIGVSRLIGAILETQQNNDKIIWPDLLQPFHLIILDLNINTDLANTIYNKLNEFDILLDDTNDSYGIKIKNAELMGMRFILIIGQNIELIDQKLNTKQILTIEEISILKTVLTKNFII